MTKLFWFPSPLNELTHGLFEHDDDHIVRVSKPDTHPSGRAGISWELPDTLNDKHGARVIIQNSGYYDTNERGVVDVHYFDYDAALKGISGILIDDSVSVKIPEVPIPI